MFDFTGKKIVITGATGGIGSSVVKKFYDLGAMLFITGTNEERLKNFIESENFDKDRVFYKSANIGNAEECVGLISDANAKLGGIDAMVCNAGVTRDGLFIRMKDEDFDDVVNINLKSTFILNREVAKIMMKQRSGKIINIASIVGFTGNFGQVNYVASKSGMVGMTKSMALELAGRGVNVNCIAPGFIKTNMTDKISENIQSEIIKKIPMQKYGNPDNIADSVLFLASDYASYITGTTIHVNGGMFMA